MFGTPPAEAHAPMDKDDKPEFDDSAEFGPDGVQKFQSVIGAVQWLIALCQFDIAHVVMPLSRFCCGPRERHLECLKRAVGFLRKHLHGAACFHAGILDCKAQFGNLCVVAHLRRPTLERWLQKESWFVPVLLLAPTSCMMPLWGNLPLVQLRC